MATNNSLNINLPLPMAYVRFAAITAAVTGDGTAYDIVFDTEEYDTTSSYAAGNYTAPVSGKYYIKCDIYMGSLAAGHTLAELKVGTAANFLYSCNNPGVMMTFNNRASIVLSGILNLNALDVITANIKVSNGAKTVTLFGAAATSYARLQIKYLND